MRLARERFDDLTALPDGENNLRVIIIITDGEPCALADVDEDGNCSSLAANQAQLSDVEQLVNRVFPPATHELYILAMENPNEPYWSTYEGQWLQIVRDPDQARVIPTASNNPDVMPREVTAIMTDIVDQLSSSLRSSPIQLNANGRGSKFIPPYVGSVSFNVFKGDIGKRSSTQHDPRTR